MTERATHSPGPWRLEMRGDETEVGIFAANGDHVQAFDLGGVFQFEGKSAYETEVANAHLIAAAPEMQDALMQARLILQDELNGRLSAYPPDDPDHEAIVGPVSQAISRIDAALAKARGEGESGQ